MQTGSGVNYGLTKGHITPLSYFLPLELVERQIPFG